MTLASLRRTRLGRILEQLRAALWFVPSVMVAAAVAAAGSLNGIAIDDGSLLSHVVFPGGAESARAILQAIAGSVITVTGVVFSLTVVTLQLASTQFSPRLLRTFLRDVSNQIVLGTFLGTFSYALVVLRAIQTGTSPEQDVVPPLAVTGAYVLAAASVIALVYFIDHIARSIRIDSLMREVNEDTVAIVNDIHPNARGTGAAPSAPPDPPEWAEPVAAPRSGFVQAVDDEKLLQAALAEDVVVQVEPMIGDRVIAGSPLAWIWAKDQRCEATVQLTAAIERAVQVGYERTMQQDVAFGFRQLVDVATKALSPGVNDPTTAVHAVGHLAALLSLLVRRDVVPIIHRDDEGDARVVVPVADVCGYLDLACGQIRRYGAGEPAVTSELLHMLRDVARCDLDPRHAAAVAREADMVIAAAERATAEPRDLEPVRQLHQDVCELLGRGGGNT